MKALELKIPPAVQVLVLGITMWLTSAWAGASSISIPWNTAIAWVLVGVGIAIAVAGVLAFRKASTTANPIRPDTSSSVVVTGVYRLSRNPMYLGFLLVLAGWAVFLSNAVAFLFLPVFVGCMNRLQIAPEERALSARFGEDYAHYLRSVRRWL